MKAISLETLWSIVDLSPILFSPWHVRKMVFWLLYAAIATGAVYAELTRQYLTEYISYLYTDILPLSVVIFAVEPLMVVAAISVVGRYPQVSLRTVVRPRMVNGVRRFFRVDTTRIRRRANRQLAIVIACHNSRDIIPKTIEACLQHVRPEQIYVVDNGNSDVATDDSREVLQKCSPGSKYIWNCYGNKTLAQYAGVMAAKNYKYILVLDDDVILPPELDMGLDLIKDNTVGVVYPIRAAHPERRYSLFIEWQSLEYQLTGYNKLMQSKTGTVHYPHGAASMWDRKALKTALRSHDTVFFAEDAKLGIWALKNGYDIVMKPEIPILTEAPATVLGEMPNFWTQRVRSWDMALHAYFWQYVQVLFCSYHRSCCGFFVMKLTQLYTLYTILADWIRLPLLILYVARANQYWISVVFYLAVNIILLLVWNSVAYWRRPDLRLSFLCVVTFPIYACLVLVTRFFGLLTALFVYLPNYRRPPTIPEIEHKVMESWKQAMLAEEAGFEKEKDDDEEEDSDLFYASGVALPPTTKPSDTKEPVWLTDEELMSLGITTKSSATCLTDRSRAAALGQETRSLASMESDIVFRRKSINSPQPKGKLLEEVHTTRKLKSLVNVSAPVDLDESVAGSMSDSSSKGDSISSKKSILSTQSKTTVQNRVTWHIPRNFSRMSAVSPSFVDFPRQPYWWKDVHEEGVQLDVEARSSSTDETAVETRYLKEKALRSSANPLPRIACSLRSSAEANLPQHYDGNQHSSHKSDYYKASKGIVGFQHDILSDSSPKSDLPERMRADASPRGAAQSRRLSFSRPDIHEEQQYDLAVHNCQEKTAVSLDRDRVKCVLNTARRLISNGAETAEAEYHTYIVV